MELELVEKGEDSILIKIIGEDHTFCNLLRAELMKDDDVVSAVYTIEHPLTEPPKFYLKVKGGRSPEKVLMGAADRLVEQLEDLKKQLQKELKK
ncbi:MAG: DNA-directed RNA polymerase subunit L [Candidatus Hadarchaeum sp.]|uniref:DNA-directed RNA polymerase subunit L n=1 Tax=Candidatus Hadarchaeum sp. TaxID=2883567 RepID=UPI003D0C5344